jgi:hypothetical protein
MTDPPIQAWTRYIAIDIHKHYLMIGGIDAHKRIVLQPRKVELHRWRGWAQANLHPTDAVVTYATTNAWVIYDLLVTLVGRVVVAQRAKVKLIAEAHLKTASPLGEGRCADLGTTTARRHARERFGSHRLLCATYARCSRTGGGWSVCRRPPKIGSRACSTA